MVIGALLLQYSEGTTIQDTATPKIIVSVGTVTTRINVCLAATQKASHGMDL